MIFSLWSEPLNPIVSAESSFSSEFLKNDKMLQNTKYLGRFCRFSQNWISRGFIHSLLTYRVPMGQIICILKMSSELDQKASRISGASTLNPRIARGHYSRVPNRRPPPPLINFSKIFHPGHSYSNPTLINFQKICFWNSLFLP